MKADPALTKVIVDYLGGPPEVADMTKAPVTTVHGWLRVGLSPARLDHVRLAADRAGKSIAHLLPQGQETEAA